VFKKGFIPALALIPIALVSLGTIVISSITSSSDQKSYNLNPPAVISRELSTNQELIDSPAEASSTAKSNPNPTPSPDLVEEISDSIRFTQAPTPTPTPIPKPTAGSVGSGAGYTVLTYSLGSTTVETSSAYDDDCSNDCATKSLSAHIADVGGRAGINGTYFCPQDYSWCSGKVNSTDFPVWNNKKKKWMSASTLFWNGRGMMVFRPGSAQFFSCAGCVGAPSDITGGIVNYPSLLAGGNLVLDEGSVPAALNSKGTRSGIGFGNGKLFLVVARSASVKDLAGIFISLGATDAMNLDGGGSSALYDGGYRAGPGRNIPNAIVIK